MDFIKKYLIKVLDVINKLLPGTSICIFSFFTICAMFFSHLIPGEAEAHAWTIAGNVNILQLIDLMNAEGHFLIWYLCLMPFAKFPPLYPWVMYIINWFFCLLALYILWEKAPFNNLTKMFITFSAPFFKIYSIYPRCYSIGIFFMFLALSLYKDRLTKPYKYLFCLTAAANTSAPACIASGILGILFLYDLFKNRCDKRIIYVSMGIAFINLILFYFQFHTASIPDYETANTATILRYSPPILTYLGITLHIPSIVKFKLICSWIGTILLPIFFWKSKRAFTFFLSSEVFLLLFFMFVYGARTYHMFFFYIFLLIAFWIYNTDNNNKENIVGAIILLFITLCVVFINVNPPFNRLQKLYPIIASDTNLSNGNLYTNYGPIYVSVALPYLAKTNKTIYNMHGEDLNSYKVLKNYFNADAKKYNVDTFLKKLDKNKRNFIILDGTFKYNRLDGIFYGCNVKIYSSKLIKDVNPQFKIYEVSNIRRLKSWEKKSH